MPYAQAMPQMYYTPREMLERLVAFPTVSSRSNLDLIHFVEDYLHAHGIISTKVMSDCGEKANLYATIGPSAEGASSSPGIQTLSPSMIRIGKLTHSR